MLPLTSVYPRATNKCDYYTFNGKVASAHGFSYVRVMESYPRQSV